ncbi:MAG: UDP-N-acetylmuramoyl-L-alanyl-D-glutamate--2,6-diaminopimelate ligase [Bacteroidales bacterium]|nr:UDP-N-acetylmuramoyl-L-alanyl-D-glutamate--2,6-diaminopimelate ligase [Bacteroidales bacterium]
MKRLQDIIYDVPYLELIGSEDVQISSICFDSRKVAKSSLYLAQKGTQVDGHIFIEKAIESGASVVVCEDLPTEIKDNITYIKVADSSETLGLLASNYYDNPSEDLKLIGITGTNGKTTSVSLLYNLFTNLGYRCGLISTVENRIADKVIPSTHTTPDSVALNELLSQMLAQGCDFCFMEVSSHSVTQKRISGLSFAAGVFTNLSHDHLDYHKTFDAYLKAKKEFFDNLPANAFALSNLDDRNGQVMLQNTKATKHYYSARSMADFRVKIIENAFSGLHLNIDGVEAYFNLVGEFNAYNIISVYAVALLCKFDKMEVLTELSNLKTAEGRFDYVENNSEIVAIVDYAHTPDALENVLETIEDIRQAGERIITVVGCGGNRDAEKRPIMARIAHDMSDVLIMTSDNPRHEDPMEILEQMQAGIPADSQKQYLTIENRREAIKTATILAQKGDVILVAGKGHEKYQEIKGVRHHFDDKEELEKQLKK